MRKECMEGLELIRKIYKEDRYELLILDEINISLRDGFLKEEEILKILKAKPFRMELVLTGRGATASICKEADLVSEIKNVKHPFNSGMPPRKGIDY